MARGRRPRVDRPTRHTLWVPQSLWSKLEDHLYSEVEARIPVGAINGLINSLIVDYLKAKGVNVNEQVANGCGSLDA